MQTLRVPFGSVNSHSGIRAALTLLLVVALFGQSAAPQFLPACLAPKAVQAASFDLNQSSFNFANLLPENSSPKPQISETLKKMPMNFTLNTGQTDARVKFMARGRGYGLFLTQTEAVMALNQAQSKRSTVLRMQLLQANPQPEITGLDKLPTVSNYYVGNDPKKFREAVPHFAKVKYAQMYPGIDVVYYGNQQQLEYDFLVAPGADPNAIKMKFAGARKLRVDNNGDLVIHIKGGELRHHKPIIYQNLNGARKEIAGHFVIRHRNQVSFALGEYDTTKELVIDPTLTYSTYLGGFEGDEKAYAVAVKSGCTGACEVYLTGSVTSQTFPDDNIPPVLPDIPSGSNGGTDIFVAKLDATGTLFGFYTIIGDTGEEHGRGIKVTATGQSYVVGMIGSNYVVPAVITPTPLTTDPALNNEDAFVARLNANGRLVDFAYLGGAGYDQANAIAFNGTQVCVTGQTYKTAAAITDFPTTAGAYDRTHNGGYDVFVSRLSANLGTLNYSTFIGGGNMDYGNGIDTYNGVIYVVGNTQSVGNPVSLKFPTTPNAFDSTLSGFAPVDAFVLKLDPSLAAANELVYSTVIGGTGREYGYGIAVYKTTSIPPSLDPNDGDFYICGRSHSSLSPLSLYSSFPSGFPVTNSAVLANQAGAGDVFVTRFKADGTIQESRLLGGSDYDTAYGIQVDGTNVWLVGDTDSTNFPITPGLFVPGNKLGQVDQLGTDAFFVKLDSSLNLLFSTYFGGGEEDWFDSTDSARGIALAGSEIYMVGFTNSRRVAGNFPITVGSAYQEDLAGATDCFVVRITP